MSSEKDVNTEQNNVEEVVEAKESFSEKINKKTENVIHFFEPITGKVRDFVLGFGEIIVTISVIIGLVTAIMGGISDMANIGFFTGLSNMLSAMVSVIMGALVIFLLFAIYKNGTSKKKK